MPDGTASALAYPSPGKACQRHMRRRGECSPRSKVEPRRASVLIVAQKARVDIRCLLLDRLQYHAGQLGVGGRAAA
eukprot:1588071-Prymnesium_polylepis.1